MSTQFTNNETESTSEFSTKESSDNTASSSKKSSNKVIIVVALVAVVAVVGFYGMRIINSPSPTPTQPVPQLPPAEVANAPDLTPADGLNNQQEPMLQEPITDQNVDPLADLIGADPSVSDPLTMDPSQSQEADEYQPVSPEYQGMEGQTQDFGQQYVEGVPVSPDQMVQAQPATQDPSLVVPVQPDADPTLQSLMDSQEVPAQPEPEVVDEPVQSTAVPEVAPVSPVALDSAPVVQDPSLDMASLASVVGQAVSDALKPLEERWNARFDSLERRLSRVESRPRQESVPATSRPSSSSTPRASISRVPQAPKRSTNRIEVLDDSVPTPSPRPVVRQVEPSSTPATPDTPGVSCSLGAILEGRAWLKRGDGSFESYIVGDTLPDGKTIAAITPERGIVADGKSWSCR